MSGDQAAKGIFDTPENSNAYAQRLHEDQARQYLPQAGQP